MADAPEFARLLSLARAGDARAAEELVRQFAEEVRGEVRRRLRHPGLRRLVDSLDICQSVFGDFFAQVRDVPTGELADENQVIRLLVVMARRKVAKQTRRQTAAKRDLRRRTDLPDDGRALAGRESTPSQVVSGRELLDEIRKRLSAEELHLLERRTRGQGWAAIAAELGGTPDGRRVQLARALKRVGEEIGLDLSPLVGR